jgi:hypothetical protein
MVAAALARRPIGSETVLEFPAVVEPLQQVRSTILIASLGNIRKEGHYDAYARWVPGEHLRLLSETLAATWLPVQTAAAHYAACDKLALPTDEQVRMGRKTVERIGRSMAGAALRLAREAGATPWVFFPHMQRLWDRAYGGGGIAVYKLGPKDARLDLIGFSLCESPFYRNALRGWVWSLTELFCQKAYFQERRQPDGPQSCSFRAQWV